MIEERLVWRKFKICCCIFLLNSLWQEWNCKTKPQDQHTYNRKHNYKKKHKTPPFKFTVSHRELLLFQYEHNLETVQQRQEGIFANLDILGKVILYMFSQCVVLKTTPSKIKTCSRPDRTETKTFGSWDSDKTKTVTNRDQGKAKAIKNHFEKPWQRWTRQSCFQFNIIWMHLRAKNIF